MRKFFKSSLVIFGAIVCSTLFLQASDSIRGISGSMPGLSFLSGDSGVCPVNTKPLVVAGRALCIDMYEVSVGNGCEHNDPKTTFDTEDNVRDQSCRSTTDPEKLPWTYVSQTQAARVCAKEGKRLPTSEEWYKAALGSEAHDTCVVDDTEVNQTGTAGCISSIGAHDMIGNVWEWVDAKVVDGMFDEQKLPKEGYVASVDISGLTIATRDTPQIIFGDDYFWSDSNGSFGMIRGGFYGSRTDGGLYTINAKVEPIFISPGVGFRCVSDI